MIKTGRRVEEIRNSLGAIPSKLDLALQGLANNLCTLLASHEWQTAVEEAEADLAWFVEPQVAGGLFTRWVAQLESDRLVHG